MLSGHRSPSPRSDGVNAGEAMDSDPFFGTVMEPVSLTAVAVVPSAFG